MCLQEDYPGGGSALLLIAGQKFCVCQANVQFPLLGFKKSVYGVNTAYLVNLLHLPGYCTSAEAGCAKKININ